MATTFSDIITLALTSKIINDLRWEQDYAENAALFLRQKSQALQTAIPKFNRPPEIREYLAYTAPSFDSYYEYTSSPQSLMDTLTVAFALTWPVLLGSRSFKALGLTSVEVMRKKMSNRNTRSVMDDIPRSESTFVVLLNFMAVYFSASAGSLRRSMKSMVVLSILKAMSEICEVR